jgi:hypothetical protein
MAETYDLASGASRLVPNRLRNYALIAVSELDITTSAERPTNPSIKMHAGEVKWFAGGVEQEWRNRSSQSERYVILSMVEGWQ